MTSIDLDRAFATLREESWTDELFRERLSRELSDARPARHRRRGLTAAAALVLLAGLGFGAVWLREWFVTTRIEGQQHGPVSVETDDRGLASFVVPVGELEDLEHMRFDFDVSEVEAPWVDFDIRIEDGLAHVTARPRAEAPIDATRAREAIEELRSLTDADGGALWGLSLDRPLLFVDRASRAVVAESRDADGLLFPWRGLSL